MQKDLIRVLLYFDVFSHPLTKDELFSFVGVSKEFSQRAELVLDNLVWNGFINFHAGFYYFGNNKSVVSRRLKSKKRAEIRMRDAKRYARIISFFPFVRGVFLSGSISKGSMAEDDDIDYFIITEPGRLWISRSLLIMFKKIFLFNSYRNFCINYLVDTEHLLIGENNRFVATEIVTTIPAYNTSLHRKFIDTNSWVKSYYPTFYHNGAFTVGNPPFFKLWLEKLFNNYWGDRIDNYFLKRSLSYMHKKFKHMDEESFDNAFIIKKYELRFLPNRNHIRILKSYKERIADFVNKTGICLNS